LWAYRSSIIKLNPSPMSIDHEYTGKLIQTFPFYSLEFNLRLLTPTTPFHRVVSLLRISSSKHLDIPQIHELARAEFQRAFPSEPLLLRPEMNPFLHEGLQVASQFGFSAVCLASS
jgi:hypothetical protein